MEYMPVAKTVVGLEMKESLGLIWKYKKTVRRKLSDVTTKAQALENLVKRKSSEIIGLMAGFKAGTVVYMCLMFAVTTPLGIALGMVIFAATGYDDQNPNALIMEGLLGSLCSGILIYMALVDLIALDFFHNKMLTTTLESGSRLKKLLLFGFGFGFCLYVTACLLRLYSSLAIGNIMNI